MSFFITFAIFTTIHFHVALFFTAGLIAMTGIGAFAIFTAIHRTGGCIFIIFAATRQLIVYFHGGFETGIIMTNGSYLLLDLSGIGGGTGISNGQLLRSRIPFGFGRTGIFSRFLNTGLAHTAITGNLE